MKKGAAHDQLVVVHDVVFSEPEQRVDRKRKGALLKQVPLFISKPPGWRVIAMEVWDDNAMPTGPTTTLEKGYVNLRCIPSEGLKE
jgi:hypothetical protein